MLGQKVAIVSSKPQTTRTRITGVLSRGETQYVLLDTPGLRKANRRADKYGPDSLAAQVSSENPLAAQYAQTILGRIVCSMSV